MLDTLQEWLGPYSTLLRVERHANTTPHILYLTTLPHPITILSLNYTPQHFQSLIKGGDNVRFIELTCALEAKPDLDALCVKLTSNMGGGMTPNIAELSDTQSLVVIDGIEVLSGLGCSNKEIVMLVQRVMVTCRTVVTIKVSSNPTDAEAELDSHLQCLFDNIAGD